MSRHYRRGLTKLLRALDFHCDNTAFQPVMDALKLLDRYADSEDVFYDRAETVPIEYVVPEDWQEAVADERGRIERIPYELCVLVALRKAIRPREIWVEGGKIWRNPEVGLPADFDDDRDVHHEALKRPRDSAAFIAESWTVLGEAGVPIEPIERYLAYLPDIDRSPNTVKAYAHDLKDYFTVNPHKPKTHIGMILRRAARSSEETALAWQGVDVRPSKLTGAALERTGARRCSRSRSSTFSARISVASAAVWHTDRIG
ncbi:hypothetical protein E1295_45140 [Nonomuraea mesophila]|uniref:Core-binding (CB) domain-containing protein n=1 Tax=Nonomuraea mesophila TaxID=2530382 RepID=A0A4R5E5B0_9ACTN|nr:hypothetical protein [Nonomuraea mesophila]TDE25014.1 hypothetical protein E1295_45140 [Nonomuraea mesophila]